jgi:CRP-like cAMP-binding protein
MDLVNLLKGVELFTGLDDDQLRRLAAISQVVTYQDGDVVFAQGAPGEELYVIQDGQFEVIVGEDPETSRTTVYLGQGQIFGEMALIDYGERSATIRCASDGATLAIIGRADFEALCSADTAIGYIAMRNMASDLSFKLRHRNQLSRSE